MKHAKAIGIAASFALLSTGCGKDETEVVMVDLPLTKIDPSSSIPGTSTQDQVAIVPPDKDFVFSEEKTAALPQSTSPAPSANQLNGSGSALPHLPSGPKTTTTDSSPNSYVQQMLNASGRGDESDIFKYQQLLETSPKPPRGDKAKARNLNDQALSYFKQNDYVTATALLADAQRSDPGDIEIANNYGYALVKSNRLDEAKEVLFDVLSITPSRAIAWANLGEVLARQGDQSHAVAAFLNTYRFSKTPQKTHEVFLRHLESEETPGAIKEALSIATAKMTNSVTK